jgi:hypothetical protein
MPISRRQNLLPSVPQIGTETNDAAGLEKPRWAVDRD